MRRLRAALAAMLATAIVGGVAHAQTSVALPNAAPEAPEVIEARELFVEGARRVHVAQWAEALASFERSAVLRPHAVTTYNIGACERALGRATSARRTLARALAENDAAGGAQLSGEVVADVLGFLSEIDRAIARVFVRVVPENAAIAVDGRPLDAEPGSGRPVMIAGTSAPGPGQPAPAAAFTLVLDPGMHVLTLSRKGFGDIVLRHVFRPGWNPRLDLTLDRLPGLLRVSSNRDGSVVTVDGRDVGIAPVGVPRPAGRYRIVVVHDGFVPYEAQVSLRPGEEADLRAKLEPESTPLTKRWWFWSAAGLIVAGAVVTTYAVARPDAERPAPSGGGLGWTVEVP